MFKIKYSKIIVLGSGPSGYTFSLYIIRSKLNLINISGENLGGQLNKTNYIENWPSILKIKGVELMFNFYNQLINLNIEIYNDEAILLNLLNKPFLIFSKINFYICDILNICTGSLYKIFNIKNYKKYLNKNISNCSICDAHIYNKKIICAIGGGDSCFENLIYLLNFYKFLILVNRNKFFKSNIFLIEEFFFKLKNNVFFKLNYFLLEFIGDDFILIYLKLKNFFNFNINLFFLEGLFIFIGNFPNSFIFGGQLKIKKNFILTKKKNNYSFSLTSLNYIFSSGDVQDFLYKQAITSSASGCFSYFDLIYYYKKIF